MHPQIHKDLKDLLLRGLSDDGYALDWTGIGCANPISGKKAAKGKSTVSAKIIAKAEGVYFGQTLARAAEAVSQEIDLPFKVRSLVEDGAKVRRGTKVLEWKGSAAGILALERPFLNLACYLGGIATRTRGLVDLVESEWKKNRYAGEAPRVTSTRKILPFYRDAGIAAVIAGGGKPHRVSLSGGILIKENHIATAGGISAAIRGCRATSPHLLKVEIEVTNLAELKQALAEKADVVMLDNFSPEEVAKAIAIIGQSGHAPLIECSGGISEETITAYAQPGVHILSIGGLTHSVKALDLSLLVD